MDMSENPMLEAILSMWAGRMQSSDAATIRAEMWYPAETPLLQGGWSRSESACESLEAAADAHVMVVVDRTVGDMSIAMREALQLSLGLDKNVWYFLVNCPDLPPAFKAYAHQQLGDGLAACVKARRVTREMVERWAVEHLTKYAQEAKQRVWRALCAEGVGG